MKINIENAHKFIEQVNIADFQDRAKNANKLLHSKEGPGKDYLGWVELPVNFDKHLLNDINEHAEYIRKKIDIMITIGIGGSYLGAKAVIEALSDNFADLKDEKSKPIMLFAGQNLSEDYLFELCDLLENKEFAITVISKSGTTTEPAVAFRILKNKLVEKYGRDEAKNRIIAITDKEKGALKTLAEKEGYKSYIIPDDVGGRFSVLTPVGLFPIAVAGFDINEIIKGARSMFESTSEKVLFEDNEAEKYALIRNLLYQNLYSIEVLVSYNPKLTFFAEWWKQLYGESEGKDGKGIFPASVNFTTDLHSMGQYLQDGVRNMFETVISVEKASRKVILNREEEDLDDLNYIAGKRIEYINKCAQEGTIQAHLNGEVPIIQIKIPEINEFSLGELIYFFEKACGISGYILGVNPFDQPGVEEYKRNMFKLLGKSGY